MLPQAHKFLTGYAPIRSMARVGAAAGALLAIPAEQLAPGAQPRVNAPPLSRQLQRGLTRASPAAHLLHNQAPTPIVAQCGSYPIVRACRPINWRPCSLFWQCSFDCLPH